MTNPLLVGSAGVSVSELASEVAGRRDRLARALQEEGIEALVVASEANAVYLTGYETTFWANKSKPFAVLFAPPQRPYVICHLGEAVSVELDAIDVAIETYAGPTALRSGGDVQLDYQLLAVDALLDAIRRTGASSIGLERSWHFMPGFTPLALERLAASLPVPARDASQAIWRVRRIKSDWELGQMRAAARAAELTHAAFAELARPGMSERELTRLLRRCAYDAGAERVAYSGIVAGIQRAPLGGPTDRTWQREQLLCADICLQLNGGYFADFNRIYAGAAPDAPVRRGYELLVQALERAHEQLRTPARVSELALAISGEEPSIYSRVGHGLGLEMPEPPSISSLDGTPLRPGEVICIEPNRFDADVGWLVGEEEIVITASGHELMSPPFPPELPLIV